MRALGIVTVGVVGLALIIAQPAWSDGGGGGSGGGAPGADMPGGSMSNYDPAVEFGKGVAALKASQFKDALKAFRNVIAVAPKDVNAHYLAGVSAAGLSDWKKAGDYYEKAIKLNPRLIGAHRQLGVIRAKSGDSAGAAVERDLLKARLAACGASCADQGELTAAVAEVEGAIAAGPLAKVGALPPGVIATPADGDRAYLAAVSLINEHRYADAIASLDRAGLSFGPHPDVLTYLGFANRKLGRLDVAERYYRSALAIAPDHLGALEYYGELMVERGNLAGARANLARLDRACRFGCYQAEELRGWIALGRSPV